MTTTIEFKIYFIFKPSILILPQIKIKNKIINNYHNDLSIANNIASKNN